MASEAKPPLSLISRLRRTGLAVLAVIAFLIALCAWLVGTTSGARTALSLVEALSGGSLQADGVGGRISGRLTIERLLLAQPDNRITLSGVELTWRPGELLRRTLHVESVHIRDLQIEGADKKEREPPKLPERIGLPFNLHVDDFRLQNGAIGRGATTVAHLGPVALRLDFEGNRYALQLHRLALGSPLENGQLAADISGNATLSSISPYTIQGRFASDSKATVEQRTFGAAGTVTLGGSLQQLETAIDLAVDQASIDGTFLLHPFSASPLGRSQLSARGVDLARFDPGLPATAIELRLSADENGAGELRLANPGAGTYDAGKLPLHSLLVTFRQDAGRLLADRIVARLGTQKMLAGVLEGQGQLADAGLRLNIRTDALDLKRLDRRARTTRLTGEAELTRAGDKQEIKLSLSEPLDRQQRLTLDAHAILSGEVVSVPRAELRAGSGRVDLSGQLALGGNQAFSAQGKVDNFRLRELGNFPQFPDLDLNGKFTLRGMREPRLEADLSYNISDSRLAGQPLSGEGEARLRGEHLEIARMQLSSGANRLNVEGRMTGDDAMLSFTLDAPQLGQLGSAFGGEIRANGTARGTLARPRLAAEWSANGARLPGNVRVERMQGKAQLSIDRDRSLPLEDGTAELTASGLHLGDDSLAALSAQLRFSPKPDAPLQLALQAQGISTARLRAERFTATAKGSTANHTIDLALDETGQSWAARGTGGLSQVDTSPRWKGNIQAFDARGRFEARLASPAPLLLSGERVQLEQFILNADAGRVAVDLFSRDDTGIVTRGSIDRLHLAKLLRQTEPAPPLKTDLELAGEWNIRIGETLNGTLGIRRERGDLTVLANAPVTLGLSALTASAAVSNGRLNVKMLASGQRLGRIEAEGGTTIGTVSSKVALAPDAPLFGTASIDVPSLAWIGPLLSPSTTLGGNMKGEVALEGNVSEPRLAGRISGQALRLALADVGLDLRDGTLDSEFQGNRLLVRALNFQGEQGRVSLSGPIDFSGGTVAAQVTLQAERFALLNRSDRRIVISGASELNWRGNEGKANGNFTINSGLVDLGSADKPRLSDDVVIVGQEKKQGVNKTAFDIDVTVALADSVALKGRGLDAMLGGEVRLLGDAGETLQAQGTINVTKGTYSAYGRELKIEQGLIRFRGALNNPSLDILAMRRGQEVEAGVSIRGTALTPRVSLVSEPTVPDADKLSWLVLGRGLSSAGDTDVGALQSAAGALLSEGAKAGVQSRIASTFGLDTVSVGTSQDTLQQRIVTVGKQVSSRLYLSYQQGLESAGSVVQVRYALSPKLSVEAEAGSRSAISLFYNIAFD